MTDCDRGFDYRFGWAARATWPGRGWRPGTGPRRASIRGARAVDRGSRATTAPDRLARVADRRAPRPPPRAAMAGRSVRLTCSADLGDDLRVDQCSGVAVPGVRRRA